MTATWITENELKVSAAENGCTVEEILADLRRINPEIQVRSDIPIDYTGPAFWSDPMTQRVYEIEVKAIGDPDDYEPGTEYGDYEVMTYVNGTPECPGGYKSMALISEISLTDPRKGE